MAPVLTWLEPFLGGDPFMKVVGHEQFDTMGPSETSSGTSVLHNPIWKAKGQLQS